MKKIIFFFASALMLMVGQQAVAVKYVEDVRDDQPLSSC